MKTEKEFHDENEFDPFGKPLSNGYNLDNPRFLEPSLIKSVFCGYDGRLIVYDIHGKKVHELSGMITYDKYVEIEKRSNPDITEITGLEEYRCIACELKAKQQKEQLEDDEDVGFKTPSTTASGYKASFSGYTNARRATNSPQPSSSKPPLIGKFGTPKPPLPLQPSSQFQTLPIITPPTTTPPPPYNQVAMIHMLLFLNDYGKCKDRICKC